MTTPFDKIYFLCLSDDETRCINVRYNIIKLGLTPDQYTINYTSKMPYSDLCGRLLLGNDYEHLNWVKFKNAFAGIFNCATEHYKMIRSAYNIGYEKILICEDDIAFIDNVDYIKETFNKLPDKFGIVKFYYTDYQRTTKEFGLRKCEGYCDGVTSTLCYALDRDGMKAYMESFEKQFKPADDVFEGCLDILQVCTGPQICHPCGYESTIEN